MPAIRRRTLCIVRQGKAASLHTTKSAMRLWPHCRPTPPRYRRSPSFPAPPVRLGYTMQVEEGDKYLMTKEELENKIATLTGGRAAEEIVFDSITTGASNDIEQATKLARAMITRYGMSEDFGMVAMETVTNQYLGGDTTSELLRRDPAGHRPEGSGYDERSSMRRL